MLVIEQFISLQLMHKPVVVLGIKTVSLFV